MFRGREVPGVLLTTSRCTPLHLTLDNLQRVVVDQATGRPRIAGIQILVDTFVENKALLKCEPAGRTSRIHEFAGLAGFPLVMAVDDPCYRHLPPPRDGNGHVVVRNSGGNHRMEIAEYQRLVDRWLPDAFVTPMTRQAQRTRSFAAALTAPKGCAKFTSVSLDSEPPEHCAADGIALVPPPDLEALPKSHTEWIRAATCPVFLRGNYSPTQVRHGLDHLGPRLLFDSSFVDTCTAASQSLTVSPSGYRLMDLADAEYFCDPSPIDEDCQCFVCRESVTRSYIHHLIKTEEMLASVYLQAHNLHQYLDLFPIDSAPVVL